MKIAERYLKAGETPPEIYGEIESTKKTTAKLVDAHTEQKLANPSLMLWALLGLSAEHSYILTPLS